MTTRTEELACIELVELVTDYLEDALPQAERNRIERHLATCDGCTRFIEQIRETIAAAGRLTPDDVPAPVVDRLLAVFRAARSGRAGA
ncbi:MAG TPA: anti-sigma factor [Candidatus Limnocylindrales bacterium]|nr:anti-sigma factor [Candidatus Limnocylindrales bacterium]